MNECVEIYIKRVQFLRDNIAPDDIYEFAEQALSGSEVILRDYVNNSDVPYMGLEPKEDNNLVELVVANLVTIRKLCESGYKGGLRIRTPWDDS